MGLWALEVVLQLAPKLALEDSAFDGLTTKATQCLRDQQRDDNVRLGEKAVAQVQEARSWGTQGLSSRVASDSAAHSAQAFAKSCGALVDRTPVRRNRASCGIGSSAFDLSAWLFLNFVNSSMHTTPPSASTIAPPSR